MESHGNDGCARAQGPLHGHPAVRGNGPGHIVRSEGRIVADGTPREVFSQVELLRSEGLAVPATTQLIYELRRDGYDLPLSALTVSECADAVMSAI